MPEQILDFTYDLTTAIGQARFLAADSDYSAPLFSDAEIQFCLDRNGAIPELAAAYMLDTIAVDQAHLANTIKIGTYGNTKGSVYAAVAERAKYLRSIAPVPLVCNSPDQIFSTTSGDGATLGTMDLW